MKKLLFLAIILAFYLTLGELSKNNNIIPKEAIRIRILANSNSLKDQENKTRNFFNILFDYFKIALIKIENNYLKQYKDYLTVIAFLYSVAYVKVYLYLFAQKIIKQQIESDDIQNISNLLTSETEKTRQTIRLFFIKCLIRNYKSFTEFIEASWDKDQLQWVTQDLSENKQIATFSVLFLNIDHDEFHKELTTIIKKNIIEEEQSKSQVKELFEHSINHFNTTSKRNDFDYLLTFYDVSVNIYFSKFYNSDSINNS